MDVENREQKEKEVAANQKTSEVTAHGEAKEPKFRPTYLKKISKEFSLANRGWTARFKAAP